MATQPTSPLPEDRTSPPGDEPENGPVESPAEEGTGEVAPEEPPQEEPAPTEGEPATTEEAPAQEPEAEAEVELDPNFVKKFGDPQTGEVDWVKAHKAYLELEKKLSAPRAKPADVERMEKEAEAGRYAIYLNEKYPDMPLRKAHEREQALQAQQAQQRQGVPVVNDVEELSDDQVDQQVNALIAKGDHAKAQRLAARFTPESRAFRAMQRQQAADAARAKRAEYDSKMRHYMDQLADLQSKAGDIPAEVWTQMQQAIRGIPPKDEQGNDIEIDMEAIYELAKARVAKASKPAPKKVPVVPSGRQPKPGAPAPKAVARTRDQEYLTKRRELTLDEVMGKD